jgi:hypothetical protein
MRDPADTRTSEIEAFPLPKTPGRKRVYASAADRQKAYRDRKRAGQVPALPQVSDPAPELRERLAKMETERDSWKRCYTSACKSLEALALERDQLRTQVQALQSENESLRGTENRETKNRNVTEIQPAFYDDLALLLAQYCQSDGVAMAFPACGSASSQEIIEAWTRLHAAFHGLKKRNGTKKGKKGKDITSQLQNIARMLDHSVPEMKKHGRAKLDELILAVSSD